MRDWLSAFITHPIVLLSIGGAIGTNARYWLGKLVVHIQGAVEFPWATFLINVSGSMVLGFVAAAYLHQVDPTHPDPAKRNWYLLLGAGFCGGFTTFSTFSLETLELIRDGKVWAALAYAVGSVVLGLLAVWVAMRLMGK
jgi:CrcB protein